MSPLLPKTSRRTLPAPPKIAAFIEEVMAASTSELPAVLDRFQVWTYPKGDLFQWVAVLNRFDKHLDTLCTKYDLNHKVQQAAFDSEDRESLVAILKFSVFLLDHCANRGLYASGNIIDKLLWTTDIDVLEQVVQLALRLAQRASDQRSGKVNYPLSQERLWDLAASLMMTEDDTSTSMTNLLETTTSTDSRRPNFKFAYFRTVVDTPKPDNPQSDSIFSSESMDTNSSTARADTPNATDYMSAQDRKRAEGVVTIDVPYTVTSIHPLEKLFTSIVRETRLPERYHYKFLLRLRLYKSLHNIDCMKILVNIRIMSLASAAYVANEPTLQSRLSSLESDLILQLARLTHPDLDKHNSVMAASLRALEAIAHHRPRLTEVLNVLGASIDHGILMYGLRKTLTEICNGQLTQSSQIIDAQISILHYLCTTNVAGSMLCSAGLIQLLLFLITNCQTGSLRVLVKAVNLLDHLVYGFPQAFTIFCEAQGVNTVVERIAREVDQNIENKSAFLNHKAENKTDYAMTHERFSALKTMLKFIVHMMQSSGTGDGLRTLIESSLLRSMRTIYSNVDVFGSSVFAGTTNIMASFIHNEPSSYQVLHEAQLPQLFLDSVSKAILPAADVMTAIPNVFGAICLNSAGLTLFNSSAPIPNFLKIFTSFEHCQVLRDADLAGLLGSSVDELVRHHPSLRDLISHGILQLIQEISALGSHQAEQEATASKFASYEKELMNATEAGPLDSVFVDEDNVTRPSIVLYIDTFCRFLEGYLQNTNHAHHFVAQNGVDQLLGFYRLRSLPYDFAKSHAALSLSHVLRLASEADTQFLVDAIFRQTKSALKALESLTSFNSGESFFQPFLDGRHSAEAGSQVARKLQIIHAFTVLLADLYAAPMSSQARPATPFCHSFATNNDHAQLLSDIGVLHRTLIWEDVKLASQLSPAWQAATQPQDDKKGPASAHDTEANASTNLTTDELASSKYRDLKMVRFFLCQIPPCIVPFFQGLTKMLSSNRRTSDHAHRLVMSTVAQKISVVLEGHLAFRFPTDANLISRQSFALMALSFWQMLLLDDRNSAHLMTWLLLDFNRGLEMLAHLTDKCWQEIADLEDSIASDSQIAEGTSDNTIDTANDREAQKVRLSGCLQLALTLWSKMTSDRIFFNSPQTTFLEVKDRNKERAGYLEPKSFLYHLRMKILPTILRIWQESRFSKVTSSMARLAIVVLAQCLDTDPSTSRELSKPAVSSAEAPEQGTAIGGASSTDKSYEHYGMTDLRLKIELVVAAQSLEHLATFGDEIVFETVDLFVKLLSVAEDYRAWIQDLPGMILGALESIVDSIDEPSNARQFRAVGHLFVNLFSSDVAVEVLQDDLEGHLETLIGVAEAIDITPDISENVCVGYTNLLMGCDVVLAHLQTRALHQLSDDTDATTISATSQAVNDVVHAERLLALCTKVTPAAQNKLALVSLLRLLVRLTSQPRAEPGSITLPWVLEVVLAMKKIIAECDENIKVTFVIFLRNIIENEAVLRQTFRKIISDQLAHADTRIVDVNQFTQPVLALAQRNVELFLGTTHDLCHLVKRKATDTTMTIELKPALRLPRDESQNAMEIDNTLQEIVPSSTSPVESKGLIKLLLDELVEAQSRFIEESKHEALEQSNNSSRSAENDFKAANHQSYMYLCMLLQVLTELIAAHDSCKAEFFAAQPRFPLSGHSQQTGPDYPSVLHWFLVELVTLVPTKLVYARRSMHQRIQANIIAWTRSLAIALCTDTCQPSESIWRHKLLDGIYDNIKSALQSETTIDIRYGQLIAYAGLVERLVSASTEGHSTAALLSGDLLDVMARLLLEKNFVGLLSQILAELDHKFPLSQEVVRSVLKPLKLLTKMAQKLPDLTSPFAGAQSQLNEPDGRVSFENTDAEVSATTLENREETPDLYRHSALGMFEADLHESEEDSYDSDEDEEM